MDTYILSLLFVFLRCPAENSGCRDSESDCPTLIANGGCSSTTLAVTCKLSCNNCHIEDCGDFHASCAGWAASGECTANPGYMLVSCLISCGVCSPETPTIPVTIQQQMTSPTTTMTSLATTTPPTTTTIPSTTAPMTTTTTETTTTTSTPSSPSTTMTSQAPTTTALKSTTTTTTTTNTTPSPVTTTTTTKSTTAAYATSKQPNCVCTCVKNPLFTFNTSDTKTLEMQVRSAMETITAELKVNTTSLSSSIRTRISASDDRPSAGTIGWVGAVLLGLVFVTIVLTDAVTFIAYIVSRRT